MNPIQSVIDIACIVHGRVNVTVQCLSICLSHLSPAACHCSRYAALGLAGRRYRSTVHRSVPSTTACRCDGFAAVGQMGGDIYRKQQQPGTAVARRTAARCSAANVSSVTLSAGVGSSTQTSLAWNKTILEPKPGSSWSSFQFFRAQTRGPSSSASELLQPPPAYLPVHWCTSASPFLRPQMSISPSLCGSWKCAIRQSAGRTVVSAK